MIQQAKFNRALPSCVSDALNCYDDGAIAEGDLSAFGLVLEQFHHAVADRKASISNSASELQRYRVR